MVVNFNIEFASPECYLLEESLDFSTRMKLSLAIPLTLGFAIVSGFAIQYICIYLYKNFVSRSNHFFDDIREHLSRFGRVMHVLLTFVYTSVTTHSLALFDCTQENDGQIYLDADRSLRCYESWWYRDLHFAIPAVCLYVVGIPAYFSFVSLPYFRKFSKYKRCFKWRISENETQNDGSFKPDYQFFVVVQLFQKLILIVVSMFLTRYIGLQIVFNLAILSISFQLILKYKPYKFESLNSLELLSHLSAITVLSFGLPFHLDKSGADSYKFFVTLFILLVIFGFNLILLCVLVYELLRGRKSEEGGTDKAMVSKSVLLYN
ncbi:hypothetical protein BKA69DRAFT_1097594 [Paraphysoderma sedebokerense]|nr:hypothetical protein BKA69DRAFT_1097594 [Paraphysoderma sedebokerense]